MAGSSVTPTYSSNFRGEARERFVDLACVSDDAAGTIPDQALKDLDRFELKEVVNINPGASQPTTAYKIKIVDAEGGTLYISPTGRSVTASAKEFSGGHEYLGWYPRIDGTITVKFRNTDDDAAANVGNSKTLTVRLRFEIKRGM